MGTTWQDKAAAAGWALVDTTSPPPSPSPQGMNWQGKATAAGWALVDTTSPPAGNEGTSWQVKAAEAGWALVASPPPAAAKSPGDSESNLSDSDDNLSGGAVAGIAVGCAIAGGVLGAAAVILLTLTKKGKVPYEVNLAASPESKL